MTALRPSQFPGAQCVLCGSPGRVDEDSLSYRPVILQALGPSAITLWAHTVGPEGRRGHSDCACSSRTPCAPGPALSVRVTDDTGPEMLILCSQQEVAKRLDSHPLVACCVRQRQEHARGSKANACGVTGVPRGAVGGEGHRRRSLVMSREEGSFRAGRESRTTCRVRARDERTVQTHVAAGGGASEGTGGEGLTVLGPSGSRGRSPRTPAGCRPNREGALVRAGGSGRKGWPAVTLAGHTHAMCEGTLPWRW